MSQGSARNGIIGRNSFSAVNSTTTPLAGNATFTGAFEDIGDYVAISVLVNTNSVATLDALKIDFSTDGINVDRTLNIDLVSNGDFVSVPGEGKFVRIRLTAGAAAQSFLRLATHYSAVSESPKFSPLIDQLSDSSSAQIVRSVIEGKTTGGGGGYVPVKVTPSGALTVESTVAGTVSRPSSYTTGNLTAAGQSVSITVPEGQSSWTVYLSGTFSATSQVAFEGSPDNVNWHALNGRRNTDASTNDTTNFVDASPFGGPSPAGANPSNWRGVIGGIRFYRVRCVAFQAGDNIAVQIVTSSGVGATFLNVGLPASANLIGFNGSQFAFQSGAGRGYGITSTRLTATVAATAANLLTLYNPAGSGKTLYVYRISIGGTFGNNGVGAFDRVRFTTAPTGGTATTPVSRNSSATASVATALRANVTAGVIGGATVTGGVQEKSVLLTTGGQDSSNEDGSLILPPGTGISIQYTTVAAATTVAAEIVWHEL